VGNRQIVALEGQRFEVDGVNMARAFLAETQFAGKWDKRRVQLMWHAIALTPLHLLRFTKSLKLWLRI
jgi:hypothetical protein